MKERMTKRNDETTLSETNEERNSMLDVKTASRYAVERFYEEVTRYGKLGERKTGFDGLDEKQPFLPGLYTIGGISSVGKTTFALQLAEQLAERGSRVLYFSLEQSAFELVTKSLARRINERAKKDKAYRRFTATEIRTGEANGSRELEEQLKAYEASLGDRFVISDCGTEASVEEIVRTAEAFAERNAEEPPVVVVDYLQIIGMTDSDGKASNALRANVDRTMHELKKFQAKTSSTVVVIASLNRAGYQTEIGFEAFKESGGIEYSSDYVWGLQLAVVGEDGYNFVDDGRSAKRRTTTQEEKNRIINEEKNREVRRVQLISLKNRNGEPYYKVDFDYEPRYDDFVSAKKKRR